MAPAVGHMATLARSVSTHDPRTPLISNRDGQIVHDGREVVARIVGQIARPVRWDLCMDTMTDIGVTGLLEMPPRHPGRDRQAGDARVETLRSRRPTSWTTPAPSAPSTARPR
jgi:acyl transferase domain-containing protein